jgi:hypothetical protein
MAITRKINLGIEITETLGDGNVFLCYITRSKVRYVGEMQDTMKVPQTPRRRGDVIIGRCRRLAVHLIRPHIHYF